MEAPAGAPSTPGSPALTSSPWRLTPKPRAPSMRGASCGGVFQSTDGGANWGAINTGLTKPCVGALAVDPQTTSTLYAGTYGGDVFQSTDAGSSWRAINTVPTAGNVRALAIDPQASSTLYAGTSGGGAFDRTQEGSRPSDNTASLT